METPSQQQHPLANYQFSAEEIRVLRECNTESFFQRSLPLGTALGVGSYLGVKNGYLKANDRYGAVPKVIMGVIIGYFAGKFSYQQRCAEKLMRLPNSKLGELLQRKQNGSVLGRLNPDQSIGIGMSLSPFNSTGPSEEHNQEFTRSSSLNLDLESRPLIAGLDDIYRPSLDNPSPFYETDLPIEQAKHGTSYEELRKKNREEYNKKQQQNPLSHSMSSNVPFASRDNETFKTSPGSSTNGQRNKYGDIWTD